MIHHLLVVCVGNLCRSPMAQGLFERRLPGRVVWSAGLAAVVGQPADANAVVAAAAHGIDISAHRAQSVNGWLCATAELILVMEQFQKADLEQRFPLVRGKVFRLGEAEQHDIADPYRMPPAAFTRAYDEIERGVSSWVRRIGQLDGKAAAAEPLDASAS